jgi:AbrB family looped-hinge helix DNA binding protein
MATVAISPKYQVVIPKAVREALKLRQGQRVHVHANEAGQVVIEPELDMSNALGMLPKIQGVDMAHIENDPEGPEWPGGCDPIPDAEWVKNSKRAGLL